MIRVDSAADVAETLGLLRTLARLTQSAVAEELGCNPSRVGHYEQGRRRQSVATLIRHLAALGHGLAIAPLDESGPEGAPGSTESAEQASGVDGEGLGDSRAVGTLSGGEAGVVLVDDGSWQWRWTPTDTGSYSGPHGPDICPAIGCQHGDSGEAASK